MTSSREGLVNLPSIGYSAPPEVVEILSGMGRTEDLTFSPDHRHLAVAGFRNNIIYIFSVNILNQGGHKSIEFKNYSVIRSRCLSEPHGLSFLDNEHISVANRTGAVEILKLPENLDSNEEFEISSVVTIKTNFKCRVKSPGSIVSLEQDDGSYQILACNNYIHTVTSHNVDFRRRKIARNDGVLIRKGLIIPDGICVSPDRKWVAVSGHSTGTVLVYEFGPDLNRKTEPSGELQGIVCPHAICFSKDGKMIFVADSASPYMHIYTADDGVWRSKQKPYKSVRVLEEDVFLAGRSNAEEGGLKGMDIDFADDIVAVSCEHLTLAFYDLQDLINMPAIEVDDEIEVKSQLRDQALMRA